MRHPIFLTGIALAALLGCRTAGAPATAAEPAPTTPGIDPSIIDPGAKPCDSFYAYACGCWLAKAVIPPDRPSWSRSFTEIEERNLRELRAIAEQQAAGRVDPADWYGQKVGDFWAACVDEAAIERRGTRDLKSVLARIDAVDGVPSLARELAALHRDGIFPAFRIYSEQDSKNASQVIGAIAQGGLWLPDRDYYLKTDPKSAAVQKAYRAHLVRMLRLAGAPAHRADREAKAIFRLERSMAEAHWSVVELRDPLRTYNRLDLPGLEKAAPRFPWKAYLEALGHGELTAFNATTPRSLVRLDELLAKTPSATWRAYLKWHLLSSMARDRALPKAFVDEQFAFVSAHFTGAKEQEPRWKHCVRATDDALGEALGQAYVRRFFGADGKQRTGQLVSEIEGAMGRDLDALAWMDAPTRARAREKLARVVNKVGYPDRWRDYGTMKLDRGSFFRSVLAANAFEVDRQLSKIGKPLDRGEWAMSPPTVNAYYDPSMNEMVFPAGILQPPFFARGAPDAVNYGAIGMVVGHELTHGFDDQGRRYDANGNLVDWWTPAVNQEFERRAACVERQYGEYAAIDDLKVNGKLTLGENIADLGGLKLAFEAYQASRTGKAAEPPVAGFTPAQAFFIGYAQSWCTAERPELTRLRARVNPHSPPRWRVDGPLSNLPAFREAFACGEGSPMARAGAMRCAVW